MARKKFKIPGVSFSAKRALGITSAKRKLSRMTGIPLSKSGRKQKLGKMMTGGCLTTVLIIISIILLSVIVFG